MSTTDAPYPFEYLTRETLERRLDSVAALKADRGMTDDEWDSLIEDVIAEESAWVHGEITGEGVTPDEYDSREAFLGQYPQVRRAMARLCRASVHEIESDGLSSESASDRSESYRPPSEVRAEVRAELEDIDAPGESPVDETRVSLI